MKRIILIVAFIVIVLNSYEQQSIYKNAIKAADSILIAQTDSDIFKKNFMIIDEIQANSLISNNTIFKGTKPIIGFDILYFILINDSILTTYEHTSNYSQEDYATIHIKLDSNLKLIEKIDFTLVPKCILKREPCTFIDKQVAVKLAEPRFKEEKHPPYKAELIYDLNRKKYIWDVSNMYYFYLDDPSWEHVFIDANNEKIIDYYEVGPIH